MPSFTVFQTVHLASISDIIISKIYNHFVFNLKLEIYWVCQFDDFYWQFEEVASHRLLDLRIKRDSTSNANVQLAPLLIAIVYCLSRFSFSIFSVSQFFAEKYFASKWLAINWGNLANEQIPFLISSCFCLFQRQFVWAAAAAALPLRCHCAAVVLFRFHSLSAENVN